jgi:hypothetical protein
MVLVLLQGRVTTMADFPTGAVFVVFGDESVRDIVKISREAAKRVPEGRLLFALWQVNDTWASNTPIESAFLTSLLGSPAERTDQNWDFYGTGAVRLYEKNGKRPTSTLMWAAVRRIGDKAYFRIRNNEISPDAMQQSTIPVSHKVFTRDVANNLWHLRSKNGMNRTIERLQFLTTWSDEIVFICRAGRFTKRKHTAVTFNEDLIPVANKILYEFPDFPFTTTSKSKKLDNNLPLF